MRSMSALGRVTALTLALLLTLPAAAFAWPMAGQGPGNTRQAVANGPDDPGLRWAVDLADDTALELGTGERDAPILTPDGVLIRQAGDGPFEGALVGVDAATGELLWESEDMVRRCMPAVDSSDRLWVLRTAAADDGFDDPFVQELNARTGAPVAGSEFALGDDVPTVATGGWCNDSSLHIGGQGSSERLIVLGTSAAGRDTDHVVALDLSGTAPSIAWTIDADTAPYERILVEVPGNLNTIAQQRAGAFTASDWLLPVMLDDEPHLSRISLSTGALTGSTQIPVLDDDGNAATGTAPWSARTLVTGDRVVVSLRHIFAYSNSDVRTMVHGFALGDLSVAWSQDYERRQSTSEPGATVLASTGNLIVHNAALGNAFVLNAASGNPAAWSGAREIREIGASATPNIVTDSGGNTYLYADRDLGSLERVGANGQVAWSFSNNALELETGIAPGTDTQVGLIDDDGVLYLVNGPRMFAIDGSGGLSDCELPFDDVAPTNTHAVNICRLVQAGITSGTSPTTYAPFGDVTRGQMASFLARALGLTPISSPATPFPDVAPSNVHAGNINAIRQAGITAGRTDGTYDPDGKVTRAEMASFLARAAGLQGVSGGSGFTDVDPGNVHTANIYAVRDAGIASGTTASTFAPSNDVRRDQMASFIMRMVDFIAEQD